jgi:hypothetical protein
MSGRRGARMSLSECAATLHAAATRRASFARGVMQVAHRRLDVGVAHPLLDAADIHLGDHPRAERVAQIVKAERPKRGALKSDLEVSAQRGAVEVVAGFADEDQVVVAYPVLATAELTDGRRNVRRHRHRADVAGLRRRQ